MNLREVQKLFLQGNDMRDPKRIKQMLKEVKKVWKKAPDLRLLQLLLNCADSDDTAYQLEDDDLLKRIKKIYGGKIEYHKPKL